MIEQSTSADESPSPSLSIRLGYRPELDGVRAISIIAVLLYHLLPGDFPGGPFGVITFFVLSGFLITVLLLEEYQTTGKISLFNFYVRRFLRLMPALFLMLAAYTTYALMYYEGERAEEVIHNGLWPAGYMANWRIGLGFSIMPELTHTWTLGVEEQFYVCWPLLLLLFLQAFKSVRRVLTVTILLWGLAIAHLVLLTMIGLGQFRIGYGLDTQAGALLCGCVAGMSYHLGLLEKRQHLASALLLVGMVVLTLLGIFLFRGVKERTPVTTLSTYVSLSLGSALLVVAVIAGRQDSFLSWLFRRPFLVSIGKISYGLYVWHYVVIAAVNEQFADWRLRWRIMAAAFASFAIAYLQLLCLRAPDIEVEGSFSRVARHCPVADREDSGETSFDVSVNTAS